MIDNVIKEAESLGRNQGFGKRETLRKIRWNAMKKGALNIIN